MREPLSKQVVVQETAATKVFLGLYRKNELLRGSSVSESEVARRCIARMLPQLFAESGVRELTITPEFLKDLGIDPAELPEAGALSERYGVSVNIT